MRAAIATMLAGGDLHAYFGSSDDVRAAVKAAQEWQKQEGSARGGNPLVQTCRPLNVGESALAARIMACVAALSERETVVTGKKTLLDRPMTALVRALKALGAQVEPACATSAEHAAAPTGRPAYTLPLRITGSMPGGSVTIDGSEGSQTVTGLLMTLPLASGKSILRVTHPTSTPYIDMTLDLLAEFGIEIENEWAPDSSVWEFRIAGGQHYKIPASAAAGAPQAIGHPLLRMQGDWSGAACLLVAGAIASAITPPADASAMDMCAEGIASAGGGGVRCVSLALDASQHDGVTVRGLSTVSHQADKAILDALRAAGAEVALNIDGVPQAEPAAGVGLNVSPNARCELRLASLDSITVRRVGELKAFEFDATHCPDLFPALVALAAACCGESTLTGALRLHGKESSRGEVLRDEYAKLGIEIALNGDVMRVQGGAVASIGSVSGAVAEDGGGTLAVSSHGDHRIAMSLAVTALRAEQPVLLEGAAAVTKSYPDFWKDLKKIMVND